MRTIWIGSALVLTGVLFILGIPVRPGAQASLVAPGRLASLRGLDSGYDTSQKDPVTCEVLNGDNGSLVPADACSTVLEPCVMCSENSNDDLDKGEVFVGTPSGLPPGAKLGFHRGCGTKEEGTCNPDTLQCDDLIPSGDCEELSKVGPQLDDPTGPGGGTTPP